MSVSFNTLSTIDELKHIRQMVDALLEKAGITVVAVTKGVAAETKKAKKTKNSEKRTGVKGWWAAFTEKMLVEHADEVTAFKMAATTKNGAHLKWLSQYKDANKEEVLSFKLAWENEHPKSSAATADDASSVSDSGSDAPAKRRGAKKLIDMTAEERAKHDARVNLRKMKKQEGNDAIASAAKADMQVAPVPTLAQSTPITPLPTEGVVAEEVADEEDTPDYEPLPFLLAPNRYIRLGYTASDDSIAWHPNADLWLMKKDGSRGTYQGQLLDDGSINCDAEEPSLN